MEKRNPAKVLSNRSKPKRIALSEVSNTQLPASKESEIIKQENSATQKTTMFNGTRELNIPTPRIVASPTKVTWYYSPRVVIPIVTLPEVTVIKPNFEDMKSNENSSETIKKNSKKSKANTKKSQPNNNSSLLNWFGFTSDPSQKDTSSPNTTLNEIENPNVLKEITNPPNVTSESRPVAKRKRAPNTSNSIIVASLPTFEQVNLEMIDMVLITNILSIYDFIVKFEKLLELDLSYNRDRLNYDDLEEMILDNQFHTYLAFLQARLLSFLYKESDEGCDIDLVHLQYFLIERFPNRKFLCEKEYSEFDPRERTSVFLDLMNDALHTNKFREYIRELMMPATHKKENETRSERMKEIKFKVNEIRVKIVDKENEMKAIENQIKEIHMNCEREDVEFPNAVTKRQRIVAQRKAETELHEHLKDAADEIEIFSYSLDKLEMEHKELDMLNKTERNHALCSLRGGSILNPSGRDERFYMVARLGQDRDGRYYWFFRPLGGVFIETIKWNYSEQGSENSSLPITSSSEWQMISGIGELRMLMAALNAQDDREMSLKTNLKTLENEIESTFEMLNLRLEKKRDAQTEKMEVDSEEVKLIMSQRQTSFWKLFDTVIRKKNVWSSEEYHVIMKEYVKRKIVEFEKILQEVDLNLVFKTCESNSSVNASDYVNEIKKMISETGLIFTDDDDASSTTSSKKDKNWGWLYEVAVNWYSLEIKTFSILAVWLDVMINSGEPVVRSIKRRMREQLSEKFKCSSRLRNKKGKAVVYKEEISDEEIGDEIDGEENENENEDGNFEAQKQPSKWSFRQRKRVAYIN